jgi:hypothetical protein
MALFDVTDKAFRMQTTGPLAAIQSEDTLCLQAYTYQRLETRTVSYSI